MNVNGVEVRVIDADTHVVEPPDLWTSRLPARLSARAPRVEFDERSSMAMWVVDDTPVFPAMIAAHAGWREYPPGHPPSWEEADPATWDAKQRLARMDEYGIEAQILYPNISMFNAGRLQALGDQRFQNLIVTVFNDWQLEWTSEAKDRLVPMASVPFWDLDATIAEVERIAALGFRGVTFSQNPAAFGLPPLNDSHWDPAWARLQELRLPVNFHIGSGDFNDSVFTATSAMGKHAAFAYAGVSNFLANAQTMTQLTYGGVCHRFPQLDFVSVESGAGYVPYLLESMDWQWLNSGAHKEHPEFELLPSEFWKRQIYACFWFERESVLHSVAQLGADNLMFETDFPHPTSQSPGPGSEASRPDDYVSEVLGSLPLANVEKLLGGNACRVYGLDR